MFEFVSLNFCQEVVDNFFLLVEHNLTGCEYRNHISFHGFNSVLNAIWWLFTIVLLFWDGVMLCFVVWLKK